MKSFRWCVSVFTIVVLVLPFSCDEDESQPSPEVTSLTPQSGKPNTLVTISGKFFHQVFNENKVKFNGKDALVSTSSATQVNVLVPAGAESGPVTVTVNGMTATNQPIFTVQAAPTIVTNISPTSGRYNTSVTVTGINFLVPAENNVVTFNGVRAIARSVDATSLTVIVPARAGTGPIVVNNVVASQEFRYIPDVFVAGYEYGSGPNYFAKLWMNGKSTILSMSGQDAVCEDLAFASDDVHAVGYRADGVSIHAKYWKNNIEVPLTLNSLNSRAHAIAVAGKDVYVAGYEFNGSVVAIAKYWKNGSPVSLSDGKFHAYAFGIAVNGDDIHVVGTMLSATGRYIATHWKNGVAFPLTDGSEPSDAFDIVIEGDDIFIAGDELKAINKFSACYWKNGTIVRLTDGSGLASATQIAVSGNDVYVSGYEHNGKQFVAKCWKNNVPIILSSGNGAIATAIDVIGDDIYVGGSETIAGGINVGKYWKNGVPVFVTDGGRNTYISALAIR